MSRGNGGITGHEPHYDGVSHDWLTPVAVLDALGPFDLDPCACAERPDHVPAAVRYTKNDNGLARRWDGMAFVNPPYGPNVGPFLQRLADHGDGIALVFARTETKAMQAALAQCDAVLFLAGRLTFVKPDGTEGKWTGGSPSMLLAFGDKAVRRLGRAELPGIFFEGYGRTVIAEDRPSLLEPKDTGKESAHDDPG